MEQDALMFNFADDIADELDQQQDPTSFSDAVLYGTDWTVKTIIQQIEDGNIDLSPEFQRRDAWSRQSKHRFIESVALQLPIPQIVLAEKKEQKGTFIVLDGKQRLITLAQFAANLPDGHPILEQSKVPPPLRLGTMSLLQDLSGKTYAELSEDDNLSRWKTQFDNHTIRSAMIRAWPDENYLYEVFIRLNTGSAKLSPQELRQAMQPGPFTEFLSKFSGESRALKAVLGLDAPDFRMRDIDLLLRLISFTMRKADYRGNLKAFLDDTHDVMNRQWSNQEHRVKQVANDIEIAITYLINNFGEAGKVGRRWKDGRFDSAINRAVLDVQVAMVMSDVNRREITEAGVSFERIIIDLCENSGDFVEAISGTTKSLGAVATRYGLWEESVSSDCGIGLRIS